MRSATSVLVFLAGILFLSCASTYSYNQTSNLATGEAINTIDRDSSFIIIIPKDGFYGSINYTNSGRMTANAIKNALLGYSRNIVLIDSVESIREIDEATKEYNEYVIFPEILEWIDYATEWSGKQDILKISLDVYRIADNNLIQSVIIEGKSKIFTFGGDHPQDLLSVPISEYINTLF